MNKWYLMNYQNELTLGGIYHLNIENLKLELLAHLLLAKHFLLLIMLEL